MIESRGTPDGSCRLGTTQKQLDELHIVCTAREEESSMLSSPRRKAGAFYATWFLILREKQQFAVLREYCVKVLRQMTEKISCPSCVDRRTKTCVREAKTEYSIKNQSNLTACGGHIFSKLSFFGHFSEFCTRVG